MTAEPLPAAFGKDGGRGRSGSESAEPVATTQELCFALTTNAACPTYVNAWTEAAPKSFVEWQYRCSPFGPHVPQGKPSGRPTPRRPPFSASRAIPRSTRPFEEVRRPALKNRASSPGWTRATSRGVQLALASGGTPSGRTTAEDRKQEKTQQERATSALALLQHSTQRPRSAPPPETARLINAIDVHSKQNVRPLSNMFLHRSTSSEQAVTGADVQLQTSHQLSVVPTKPPKPKTPLTPTEQLTALANACGSQARGQVTQAMQSLLQSRIKIPTPAPGIRKSHKFGRHPTTPLTMPPDAGARDCKTTGDNQLTTLMRSVGAAPMQPLTLPDSTLAPLKKHEAQSPSAGLLTELEAECLASGEPGGALSPISQTPPRSPRPMLLQTRPLLAVHETASAAKDYGMYKRSNTSHGATSSASSRYRDATLQQGKSTGSNMDMSVGTTQMTSTASTGHPSLHRSTISPLSELSPSKKKHVDGASPKESIAQNIPRANTRGLGRSRKARQSMLLRGDELRDRLSIMYGTSEPIDQVSMARRMNMSLVELLDVKAIFDRLDINNSGRLDFEEFEQAVVMLLEEQIKEVPLPHVKKICKEHWTTGDMDSSGSIDFSEFLKWWSSTRFKEGLLLSEDELRLRKLARRYGATEKDLDEMKSAFEAHDEDGTGFIEIQEFKGILHKIMKVPNDVELPGNRFQCLWREIDIDGSGQASYEEFLVWWLRRSETLMDYDNYYQQIRCLHQLRKDPAAYAERRPSCESNDNSAEGEIPDSGV